MLSFVILWFNNSSKLTFCIAGIFVFFYYTNNVGKIKRFFPLIFLYIVWNEKLMSWCGIVQMLQCNTWLLTVDIFYIVFRLLKNPNFRWQFAYAASYSFLFQKYKAIAIYRLTSFFFSTYHIFRIINGAGIEKKNLMCRTIRLRKYFRKRVKLFSL